VRHPTPHRTRSWPMLARLAAPPRPPSVLAGTAVVLVGLVLLLVPSTGGTLTGTVRNTTDTAASSTYAACTTAAVAVGSAFFVHPLDEPGGSGALDVSGGARSGTYLGGYTQNQPGPCPAGNGRSVLLDGSSGLIANPASQINPQTFSIQVWFKTTTTNAGRLIGFGNRPGATLSTQYDRMVYLTSAGRLTFGVYPGAIRTVTSARAYNDGVWHHVVATLGSGGMVLYVDGAVVGQDPTTTSAQVYDGVGYWKAGWDNLNTWPNPTLLGVLGSFGATSNYYFAGNLAYAAVFTTQLTAGQVPGLYAARG